MKEKIVLWFRCRDYAKCIRGMHRICECPQIMGYELEEANEISKKNLGGIPCPECGRGMDFVKSQTIEKELK